MDYLIYLLARSAVALVQALPIHWVARIGRAGGALAYALDRRHRRVALQNLELIFGAEKSPAERTAIARENFRRIGEVFACMIKTAAMSDTEIRPLLEITGAEGLATRAAAGRLANYVMAGGHFGNFEIATRVAAYLPEFRGVATYRGVRSPRLNQLLYRLRTVSGNILVERRDGPEKLRAALAEGGKMLTLASDQSSRSNGVEVPFLGYYAWTSRAPVVFARRYRCALYAPICYRVGLARWRVEIGDPIPLTSEGTTRSTEAILTDLNAAFAAAVRRDPANWFWVHNRWRNRGGQPPRRVEAHPPSL
jgi:lauroyl/myristoyl acyltransferase